MTALWISLGIIGGIIALVLLGAFISFMMAFYSPKSKKLAEDEFDLPFGDNYEPYYDDMKKLMKEYREMKSEEGESVSIRSRDGLTLRGTFFGGIENGPVEIMLHGYRGTPERDMCGGVRRAREIGHNALLIDQRACGDSDGKVITFGIKERFDCLDWVNFVIEKFGSDVKIILTGISMGAATVIMAAGEGLPKNVVGVLADCGYTSPSEIIKKVVKKMKLPVCIFYPLLKIGARIFGKFNLEETSSLEKVKKCSVPLMLVHGEADKFVPCEMSKRLYEACTSPKILLTIPNAGHGLSFLINPELYFEKLEKFTELIGV
jgi:fermentation-respiration switch protein FrsA (DUF1100 family)